MKKTLGISRSKFESLSASKMSSHKKKHRFKYAGKDQESLKENEDQSNELIASTRNSSAQQNSVEYSRSLQLYQQAKQNLNEVAEIRKKMTNQTKARISAFKESETKKLDDSICRLGSTAVRHIMAAEKSLSQIRRFVGSSQVQEKYFRNMQKSLTQQIRECSKSLRSQERQYFDRLKAYESGTANFAIQLSEDEKRMMKDHYQESQATLTIQRSENQERDERVNELVRSINQLTTIYKQLNELVIQQGSIIDRIDVNIQETFTHVETGNKHLRSAQEHASNQYATKCMVFLVAAILIVAIILGFKYSHK